MLIFSHCNNKHNHSNNKLINNKLINNLTTNNKKVIQFLTPNIMKIKIYLSYQPLNIIQNKLKKLQILLNHLFQIKYKLILHVKYVVWLLHLMILYILIVAKEKFINHVMINP